MTMSSWLISNTGWQSSFPRKVAFGCKRSIVVIALSSAPWSKSGCHPCHLWGFSNSRFAYSKLLLPRANTPSDSPWRYWLRCASRFAWTRRDGQVGVPHDGLLLRWQSRKSCFWGSQATRPDTVATSADRSRFALSSCVLDYGSRTSSVPSPGSYWHPHCFDEPLYGTNWNDRFIAQSTHK